MSDEQKYTLDEARRELARGSCVINGHDWGIIADLGTGPIRILCGACGWGGTVKMGPRGGS